MPARPRLAQPAALDDLFARHPVLTLIHIVPGLLFMALGPLQFNASIRARHLRWHRWNGRVFLVCGLVIGISALVMSFGMPAIGGAQSSGSYHSVRDLLSLRAVQGVFGIFASVKSHCIASG